MTNRITVVDIDALVTEARAVAVLHFDTTPESRILNKLCNALEFQQAAMNNERSEYGGKLADLVAQTRHATETAEPDVGAWFKVTNPGLRTHGLVGQCLAVRRRYRERVRDALLIEFGPGRRHWMRREGLSFITP